MTRWGIPGDTDRFRTDPESQITTRHQSTPGLISLSTWWRGQDQPWRARAGLCDYQTLDWVLNVKPCQDTKSDGISRCEMRWFPGNNPRLTWHWVETQAGAGSSGPLPSLLLLLGSPALFSPERKTALSVIQTHPDTGDCLYLSLTWSVIQVQAEYGSSMLWQPSLSCRYLLCKH